MRPLRFRNKSAFRIDQDLTPRPLSAVVEIVPVANVDSPVPIRLRGAKAMGLLERNLHARRATRTPLHRPRALALMATIACVVPIVRIRRPESRDCLDEVCDLIEALTVDVRSVDVTSPR